MILLTMIGMGIDYGEKKIGIAITSKDGNFSLPHSVIENDNNSIGKICNIAREKEVELIVLGKSINLEGNPNPIMKDIEYFKEQLEKKVTIPIKFEEEHFTTQEAIQIQGKHKKIDSSAAALILSSYLEKNK